MSEIPSRFQCLAAGFLSEWELSNADQNVERDHIVDALARLFVSIEEAQRERDAKIAESVISDKPKPGRKTLYKSQEVAVYAGMVIARAIRNGREA